MATLKKNKKVNSVRSAQNFFAVLKVVEKMKKNLLSDMKKQIAKQKAKA